MVQQETTITSKNDDYIGLSLSGGGFRATLFHLGVVRFLYESGVLSKVTHICSVSGGSVLAAHLVLNWDRFTGSEADFERAAQELVDFTQKDVRGRVFRRWLFSILTLGIPRVFSRFSRVDLLEKEYNVLYRNQKLSALASNSDNNLLGKNPEKRVEVPELYILASSMTNGQAVSFGPASFQIRDDDTSINVLEDKTTFVETMKVSLAVTASSAFPPAFPPVPIDHKILNISGTEFQEKYHSKVQYLTDGGVFDNLGIRKFKWIQDEKKIKFNKVIVSDAQRKFAGDVENNYKFIVGRATRSTDLLMNRISWLENNYISELSDNVNYQALRCQLKRRLNRKISYFLNTEEQFKVQNTRTDLDNFTKDEVNALVHHGYATARLSYEENVSSDKNEIAIDQECNGQNTVWVPFKEKQNGRLDLSNSEKRKINVFNKHDIFSWLSISVILFYIFTFLGAYLIKAELDSQKLKVQEEFLYNVLTSKTLVETLAGLAIHDDFDEDITQEDFETWNKLKNDAIKKNAFFHDLFNKSDPVLGKTLNESIDEALEEWKREKYNGSLRDRSVKFGNRVGLLLIQKNDPSYTKWLTESRLEWYKEIEIQANKIANAESFKVIEEGPVKKFWRLYLGNLCLVEGKLVASEMGKFGALLDMWNDSKEKPPEMYEAFTKLNNALNTEKDIKITDIGR